jgi:hypothetical protein
VNKKFCDELIDFFPLIQHSIENDTSNNASLPQNMFTEPLPSNDRRIQTYRLSFDTTHIAQNTTYTTILLRVFVAEGMCLPSRGLATTGGIHIQTQIDWKDL